MDALGKNECHNKFKKKTVLECFLQMYMQPTWKTHLIDLRFGLYTTDIIAYLKIFIESKEKKRHFLPQKKNNNSYFLF